VKTKLMPLLVGVAVAASALPVAVLAENAKQERAQHPHISKAISELQEAIHELEQAPHDFGGHRAAAVDASRNAVQQLQLALKYRAAEDTKKGK
jgi:multidrug efflux pump subunit AcrA (membrane-fusion protein)